MSCCASCTAPTPSTRPPGRSCSSTPLRTMALQQLLPLLMMSTGGSGQGTVLRERCVWEGPNDSCRCSLLPDPCIPHMRACRQAYPTCVQVGTPHMRAGRHTPHACRQAYPTCVQAGTPHMRAVQAYPTCVQVGMPHVHYHTDLTTCMSCPPCVQVHLALTSGTGLRVMWRTTAVE